MKVEAERKNQDTARDEEEGIEETAQGLGRRMQRKEEARTKKQRVKIGEEREKDLLLGVPTKLHWMERLGSLSMGRDPWHSPNP